MLGSSRLEDSLGRLSECGCCGVAIGFAIAWYYLKNQGTSDSGEWDRGRLPSNPAAEPGQVTTARAQAPDVHAKQGSEQKTDTADEVSTDQTVVAFSSAAARPDDLTQIKGIGPAIAAKLTNLGITTFQQIADFTEADVERVNEKLAFKGRIEREKWIEQATELAKKS